MTETEIITTNPPPPPPPPPPAAPAANNTKAVITLILGILSLPCFCGFLAGIPAIILGHLELKAINEGRSPESNRSMTKIGYIIGIVGTALTCLGALAYIGLIIIGVISSNGHYPSTF